MRLLLSSNDSSQPGARSWSRCPAACPALLVRHWLFGVTPAVLFRRARVVFVGELPSQACSVGVCLCVSVWFRMTMYVIRALHRRMCTSRAVSTASTSSMANSSCAFSTMARGVVAVHRTHGCLTTRSHQRFSAPPPITHAPAARLMVEDDNQTIRYGAELAKM